MCQECKIDRGWGRTSANDRKNSTSVWMHITMMKYTVASVTTFLNKEEIRPVPISEYANQIIITNTETSGTTHRERLAVVTRD